jgi:hypothetical protein
MSRCLVGGGFQVPSRIETGPSFGQYIRSMTVNLAFGAQPIRLFVLAGRIRLEIDVHWAVVVGDELVALAEGVVTLQIWSCGGKASGSSRLTVVTSIFFPS